MNKFSPDDRRKLARFLSDHFTLDELLDLAFDLSIDYPELQHDTKEKFVRELIMYCERRDSISSLLRYVMQFRPSGSEELSKMMAKLPSSYERTKVQIVIPSTSKEDLPEILSALSSLLKISSDDIHLIDIAKGE